MLHSCLTTVKPLRMAATSKSKPQSGKRRIPLVAFQPTDRNHARLAPFSGKRGDKSRIVNKALEMFFSDLENISKIRSDAA